MSHTHSHASSFACPTALCNFIIHANYSGFFVSCPSSTITHAKMMITSRLPNLQSHSPTRPPTVQNNNQRRPSIRRLIRSGGWMTWIPLFHVLISFQRRNIQFVPFAGCFPVCLLFLILFFFFLFLFILIFVVAAASADR